MTGVLGGKRIVVPVTPNRTELADALRQAGALVEPAAFIEIAPSGVPEALQLAAQAWLAGEYEWLAVTSRNAVLALAAAAKLQEERPAPKTCKVAAVGLATMAACQEVGLQVDLVPARPDAGGLVDEFPHGDGRVLAPLGNLASPVLERGLAARGWSVDAVEAYRTMPGPGMTGSQIEQVAGGEVDALVLTSSSVAQRVALDLSSAGIPEGTAVIAIGQTTAAGARAAGIEPTSIAPHASHNGILDELIRIFKERA